MTSFTKEILHKWFLGTYFGPSEILVKNRQQNVAIKTERFQNQNANFEVLRGSITGPLLFIIYINGIKLDEKKVRNLILYADKNVIKTTARNRVLIGRHHEALGKTAYWLEKKNKLTLIEDKTKTIILSKKSSGKLDVKISWNNYRRKPNVPFVSCSNVDSKLSSIDHDAKTEK